VTLALHSTNKQKNNERYSQLMFFQCSSTNSFIPILYSVSSILSTRWRLKHVLSMCICRFTT